MRSRFCKVCRGWHDLDEPWPVACYPVKESQRSVLPCPTVISDQIEVKSMVDGKIYTSKRALSGSYRAKGYIEVGNEALNPPPKPKPNRGEIRNAIGKAFARAGIST